MPAVQSLIRQAAIAAVAATTIAMAYKGTIGKNATDAPQEYYASKFGKAANPDAQ